MGFTDFAGSTIVHSTGGWAALAGVLVVGPRLGKFRRDGSVRLTPPSNILVVTLGIFILWMGWFGFNGGSQLALGSAADAVAMSIVLVNTNLAAAAGVIAAIAVSRPIMGRIDLFAGLNGAIAGLVSITAAPNFVEHYWAVIIGAVGGVLCVGALKLLEKIKVDDVVGAIPAHLFAGVWGTIAACIAGGATFHVQLIGILAIGAFVFVASFGVWYALKMTLGARVSPQVERLGQDAGELGMESYPEFVLMPEDFERLKRGVCPLNGVLCQETAFREDAVSSGLQTRATPMPYAGRPPTIRACILNQGVVVAPSVGLLAPLFAGEGIYTENSIRDVRRLQRGVA